jgi:hypothetical protein
MNKMKTISFKVIKGIAISMLMFIAMSLNAQVKFLGIPVDGTRSEMIQSLTQKGYIYNKFKDYVMGEFNGNNVIIQVIEYKGKVGRIIVEDATPSNETDIIIKYNNLIEQFDNNGKYIGENAKISKKENLSYEMSHNHNRYEAVYYQKSVDDKDLEESELYKRKVWVMLRRTNQGYKILIYYDNVSNIPNGEDL